jgi:hypothetical protein
MLHTNEMMTVSGPVNVQLMTDSNDTWTPDLKDLVNEVRPSDETEQIENAMAEISAMIARDASLAELSHREMGIKMTMPELAILLGFDPNNKKQNRTIRGLLEYLLEVKAVFPTSETQRSTTGPGRPQKVYLVTQNVGQQVGALLAALG